jgi:hypothetical protein
VNQKKTNRVVPDWSLGQNEKRSLFPAAIRAEAKSQKAALLDDMVCQVGVETSKLTSVMKDKKTESTKSYNTIKLGIDAHAKWYYVARQLDGATPQPVQKMELDGLLHFVAKQQKLAGEVHTCYESSGAR